MSFESLGLDEALLSAVRTAGYENPTEVQARAIPAALAGRDLRVCSATGSGKTASFVLPALMRVLEARKDPANKPKRGEVKGPRILVLVPTRELSMQVAKAASDYGRHVQWLSVTSVVGGVPYPAQLKALRSPLDILIATPGRLIDHIQSGKAVLENVEMLVLDEADRMLDMGFIEDIEHIAAQLPAKRQTLMASATFDGEVGRLAQRLQKEDVERIEVDGHTAKHENITQQLMWADSIDHKQALLDSLLTDRAVDQAVVFTSTQVDADFLADRLADMGHKVAALHGGMPQGRRNRVLQGLRSRQLRILVATDVAARGIDVPTITHVINYGLPLKAEDYVHRIGRTGRAGREGRAVTLAERRDVPMIRRIQQYTTQPIPVITVEGLEPSRPAPEIFGARPPRGGAPRGRGSFGGGFGGGFGGKGGQQDRQGYGARPPRDRRPTDRPFDRAERPAFGRQDGPFERREGGQRDGGYFERRDGGPSARRETAPFEHRTPRTDRPVFDRRDGAERPPRAPFEGNRDNRGPRQGAGKPASAGNKPRFANSGSNAGKRPRKDV
ncbi:DEAD/DEAH box helicase [Ideonella sp. B7]|uniref:DEAD/DEAH box helicase n=1 Tax=Ideonella benzenivorans TaxID=2831643 RepID=UPI001CED6AE7|nr:DEAD/DEAH box helicase [Ideonella benzenivorans]MCA6217748.1 DEAD/DEAH box helicase [Ideonella benzenivorans]